jgi:NAD(P)-dependent dehydrogenase (short-subunit alcohol dehydrogenase family)
MKLAGCIALVTGGLSGIGAAVGARFIEEGATVIAADLAAKATTLGNEPGIQPLALNVADEASVDRCVKTVLDRRGRIDCLVNCAGIGKNVPFLDTSVADYDRIHAVNLRGTFLIGQAVARAMVASRGGSIVNIASVAGLRASIERAAYGSSKAGVVLLSQVMAVELADHGVRVNVIAPGPVETPMVRAMADPVVEAMWYRQIPMARYGKPEEIAAVAAFLCSADASFVTGEVLTVDGGYMAGGLTRR